MTRRPVTPTRVLALLTALAGTGLVAACAEPTATPPPTITPSPTATFTPSATPTPTVTPTPTFPRDAFPSPSSLNVRAGPDTLHPVVGLARAETPLAVSGRTHDGGWLAVVNPAGQSGWVNARLVELRRPYDTIPTVPTPSPPPPPTATAVPMDPALPVVLAPPAVAQGDPVLVRARAPGARQVVALLGDQTIDLLPLGDDRWAGVLGVPVDLAPGDQQVAVTVIDQGGNPTPLAATLRVAAAENRPETIVLDDTRRGLADSPARQAETDRLAEIWRLASPSRLWEGAWTRPVTGTVSSGFGTARQYAGTTANTYHTGTDFRSLTGTPARAAAAGRVVLAEALEVRGNTVWLDHGWGVYSGYFHLADVTVRPGDVVAAGQVLGAVGATGMVTGPHLHWEVRVHGVAVAPNQWLLRDYGAVP